MVVRRVQVCGAHANQYRTSTAPYFTINVRRKTGQQLTITLNEGSTKHFPKLGKIRVIRPPVTSRAVHLNGSEWRRNNGERRPLRLCHVPCACAITAVLVGRSVHVRSTTALRCTISNNVKIWPGIYSASHHHIVCTSRPAPSIFIVVLTRTKL